MNIDWYILSWIQDNLRCIFLDWLMPLISALGNGGAVWLAAAARAAVLQEIPQVWRAAVNGAGGGGTGRKPVPEEYRCPAAALLAGHDGALLISSPDDYSFPSGHTLSSTIAAVILTSADRRLRDTPAIPLAGTDSPLQALPVRALPERRSRSRRHRAAPGLRRDALRRTGA